MHRGVVIDDFLLYRRAVRWEAKGDERAVLTVVLDGRQRVSWPGAADRWLEQGDFALCSAFGALSRRDEGENARTLSIEWDPGWLGSRPSDGVACGKLAPRDIRRLQDLFGAFRACGMNPTAATSPLAEMFTVLRAAGLPFESGAIAPALMDPGSARFALLSLAIDRAISTSGSLPTTADLECLIELSRWQIARNVGAMNDYFGLNGANWRDTREAWRMFFASLLATHRDATTEAVSSVLGYGAPSALCNALARRGLPSPSRMRAAVEAMA